VSSLGGVGASRNWAFAKGDMTADDKNGKCGRLKNPAPRRRVLVASRQLTLAAAGRRLGVSGERARQLFRIYGVTRVPRLAV
jgi:hypothetical protein